MPGNPVQIGPFVGGLNNVSQAGEARDNEVVELINMEVALDTSLVSRPPIEAVSGTFVTQPNTWEVLGIYRVNTATWYVIVEKPTGATTWDLLAYPQGDFAGSPTTIKSITGTANKIVAMVQYNDWVYFNVASGASDTGGRWKSGSAFSAIAAMPRGNAMTTWKDRIWITASGNATDGNTLYFSTVDGTGPHPETWNTSTDFINIVPGLGGLNTALLALSGYILIFKEDATFRFSYPSKPANGTVETVGQYVGCATANSVVGFDNYCFVYDQGRVYELINQQFTQINLNIKFSIADSSPDATAPGVDMSVVNRRLVLRYQNTIYSYSVDTKAWSQWQVVAGTPGKFIELPTDSTLSAPSTYVSSSRGATQLAGTNKIENPTFTDTALNQKRISGGRGVTSITNGIVTLTKDGTANPSKVNLNTTGNNSFLDTATMVQDDYSIPVGPGQQFTFTGTVTSSAASTNKAALVFYFLLRNGTVSTTTIQLVAADLPSVSKTITVPDNALLMLASFSTGASQTASSTSTLTSPSILRTVASSPVGLLKLTETYANTTAVEYIDCWVKTKTYDYKANSTFKKLFLWGADIKTNRSIDMYAYPLGKNIPTTWAQLESYTWAQLEAGTWDNPLSWLNVSRTVVNNLMGLDTISENGRFFAKVGKALRFRQIQYAINMTTLGNSATGPIKLFSMTTYTAARQLVVDKATG